MKTIIILIISILLSLSVSAQKDVKIEAITGGFIHHVIFNPAKGDGYTKLKRSLIAPMIGLRMYSEKGNNYKSIALFLTDNCIGENQLGFMTSIGKKTTLKNIDILTGFVLGMYTENTDDWIDKNMDSKPITIGKYIMPVVGFELNIRYNINDNYYISINNVISAITHTSISFGINL